MKISELQLADVVLDHNHHELGLMTISNIDKGMVHFFRPYAHTADFSYTGGVICYTGIETFSREIDDTRSHYELISRKTLK